MSRDRKTDRRVLLATRSTIRTLLDLAPERGVVGRVAEVAKRTLDYIDRAPGGRVDPITAVRGAIAVLGGRTADRAPAPTAPLKPRSAAPASPVATPATVAGPPEAQASRGPTATPTATPATTSPITNETAAPVLPSAPAITQPEDAMVEPIRTRTMARLLAAQGHAERARRIYAALLTDSPDDADLAKEAAAIDSVRSSTTASEIRLVSINPDALFAQWAVTDVDRHSASSVLGAEGELVLRVVALAPDATGSVRSTVLDHPGVEASGEIFIRDVPPGVTCTVAIGLRDAGRFVAIAHAPAEVVARAAADELTAKWKHLWEKGAPSVRFDAAAIAFWNARSISAARERGLELDDAARDSHDASSTAASSSNRWTRPALD